MELAMHYLWIYPAICMTLWTALTLAVAWTLPLGKPVPAIFGMHGLLLVLNPKDNKLYQRPSLYDALLCLIVGATPVASALLFAGHLAILALSGGFTLKMYLVHGRLGK